MPGRLHLMAVVQRIQYNQEIRIGGVRLHRLHS